MIEYINENLKSIKINEKTHMNNVFKHIYFEFTMFYHTAQLLTKQITCQDTHFEDYLKNAILDSYRIHLRCISDFFVSYSKNDDIQVEEILISQNNNFKKLSKKARDGINQSTGHLSKTRVKNSVEIQQNVFNQDDFINQVENIRTFLKLLTVDNIKQEYLEQFNVPELLSDLNYLMILYEL